MTDEQRDAVCILAHVYLRNGRADLALPLLMALCSLFPRDGSALALLSWALLANGDGRAASRTATEACMLKLRPEQKRAVFLIKSKALWQLGSTEESRAALDEYRKLQHELS